MKQGKYLPGVAEGGAVGSHHFAMSVVRRNALPKFTDQRSSLAIVVDDCKVTVVGFPSLSEYVTQEFLHPAHDLDDPDDRLTYERLGGVLFLQPESVGTAVEYKVCREPKRAANLRTAAGGHRTADALARRNRQAGSSAVRGRTFVSGDVEEELADGGSGLIVITVGGVCRVPDRWLLLLRGAHGWRLHRGRRGADDKRTGHCARSLLLFGSPREQTEEPDARPRHRAGS